MLQSDWKKKLLGQPELRKKLHDRPRLKHGMPWIKASDIGGQYYCEQEIELRYTIGKIEIATMQKGSALHKGLLKGVPEVELEDMVSDIESKDIYHLYNFPLLAEIDKVPLIGVLDNVIFYKTRPILVGDLKTTRREKLWVWSNERTQINMYGLLLQSIGFDCSNLRLLIGVENVWARKSRGFSPYEWHLIGITNHIQKGKRFEALPQSPKEWREFYKAWIYQYDWREALEKLRWAKDYWVGKRDSIPTKNPRKCKSCEYQKNCPKASV